MSSISWSELIAASDTLIKLIDTGILTEEEIEEYATEIQLAENLINVYLDRLSSPTSEEIGEDRYKFYLYALKAQTEYYIENGMSEDSEGGFSIGSYSESGSSKKPNTSTLSNRCMMFLTQTGLTYRGIQTSYGNVYG